MRILIVEDEHKIANSIKQGLQQEGYISDVAYTGTEGYDLASSEPYDLIILDLMLPGLTGLEITTKLRQAENHIPILILTAKNELEDKLRGFDYGADDYLTKPFAFTELLARTRALLRRPKNLSSEELTCSDLTMNIKTFTVTRNGQTIDLSKTEFSLLEYLLRNKNTVITKERLIEHVWNYDADILPNTVEVYIGYLRSKIDKPFRHQPRLIKTIRGFGYKLEEPNV